MFAILKREIKSYFQNVIGWIFVAAIVAVYGIYFFAYNLQNGYPYVAYPISSISFVLLIAVPILSMRTLAEERKSKVDQMLLTAPVSVGKIVLAKYLAMVAVFSVAILLISITSIVLNIFGTVPMGESYTAIFGFWLMGCLFLAAQSIQKCRWSISKNTISTGVFSTTTIGITLAVVVVGNLVVNSLPVTLTEIDCTYSKMYELTENTEEFLANLEEDIEILMKSRQKEKKLKRFILQILTVRISMEVSPS